MKTKHLSITGESRKTGFENGQLLAKKFEGYDITNNQLIITVHASVDIITAGFFKGLFQSLIDEHGMNAFALNVRLDTKKYGINKSFKEFMRTTYK